MTPGVDDGTGRGRPGHEPRAPHGQPEDAVGEAVGGIRARQASPQLGRRDVTEQAEVMAMDLRLVTRARVSQGHVVPGVAQDRRERRALAGHAREEAAELGLERQRPRFLGMAHEVARDALARGRARDQQVADGEGPLDDVGGDAVGGALAATEGRGADQDGVELGRLHGALVEPARVTTGDAEHRQQRREDAHGVGLGVGLDGSGDVAQHAVVGGRRGWRWPSVRGWGRWLRGTRGEVDALLLRQRRRGGRPVAAVHEDGVHVEGAVAAAMLELGDRRAEAGEGAGRGEGRARAHVLARTAQEVDAVGSRVDVRPAVLVKQVQRPLRDVGPLVVAVAGAVAVSGRRALRSGRRRHPVEGACQVEERIALLVADLGDRVEATGLERPGAASRMDPPVRRREDRVATLAARLDEHLHLVGRVGQQLLGGRWPAGQRRVRQRGRAAVEEVDATRRGALLVARPDALEDLAEPGRVGRGEVVA